MAIIGQPNVGKSSLLNAILNSERSVVSEIPGTTHDPVDSTLQWNGIGNFLAVWFIIAGQNVTLIDTAGIRKGAMKEHSLEKLTIMWALRVVEKSHVSVLVIDPEKGVTKHDMSIASHIQQHYKSGMSLFLMIVIFQSDHSGK